MDDRRRADLRDELQQTKPFRSRAQEAFLSLLRTADECKRNTVSVFRGHDITFQQYNVLRILRGAGEQGLPTLEIGARMIERQPGVTRIVDRLERKGLVARDRGTQDRRRVWCRITSRGLSVLEALDGPVDEAERRLFGGMADDDLACLVDLLAGLRARARALGGDGPG